AVDGDVTDPSLTAWREGAAVFLTADTAETSVWDVRNRASSPGS
ncbi:MAG: hypothetical protein QOE05_3511, partial [Actinomycetota bacterium]|nr:hypothetical protein [Actinomycetota bacterium]